MNANAIVKQYNTSCVRTNQWRTSCYSKICHQDRQSDPFYRIFSEVSKITDLHLEPILDVETRWYSSVKMIERLVELKPVIIAFPDEVNKYDRAQAKKPRNIQHTFQNSFHIRGWC